jgi:hypothetical protein
VLQLTDIFSLGLNIRCLFKRSTLYLLVLIYNQRLIDAYELERAEATTLKPSNPRRKSALRLTLNEPGPPPQESEVCIKRYISGTAGFEGSKRKKPDFDGNGRRLAQHLRTFRLQDC